MMTEEGKKEVGTILGWCTTGECERCRVWFEWTNSIYVCSHDCHKDKERPPLAPMDPPWDAQPRGAARKKKTAPKPSTSEPVQDMIEPTEPEEGKTDG